MNLFPVARQTSIGRAACKARSTLTSMPQAESRQPRLVRDSRMSPLTRWGGCLIDICLVHLHHNFLSIALGFFFRPHESSAHLRHNPEPEWNVCILPGTRALGLDQRKIIWPMGRQTCHRVCGGGKESWSPWVWCKSTTVIPYCTDNHNSVPLVQCFIFYLQWWVRLTKEKIIHSYVYLHQIAVQTWRSGNKRARGDPDKPILWGKYYTRVFLCSSIFIPSGWNSNLMKRDKRMNYIFLSIKLTITNWINEAIK